MPFIVTLIMFANYAIHCVKHAKTVVPTAHAFPVNHFMEYIVHNQMYAIVRWAITSINSSAPLAFHYALCAMALVLIAPYALLPPS